MRIVYTNGCFNPIHLGHIDLLNYCHHLAGEDGQVIIGLNTDKWIKEHKSRDNIRTYGRRYLCFRYLYPSFRIIPVSSEYQIEQDLKRYITKNNEVFLVKGSDYRSSCITGKNIPGIKLILVPVTMWDQNFKISSSHDLQNPRSMEMRIHSYVNVITTEQKKYAINLGLNVISTIDGGFYYTQPSRKITI